MSDVRRPSELNSPVTVTLDIVVPGGGGGFNDSAYRTLRGAERRLVDEAMDDVSQRLCQQSSVPDILRAIETIVSGSSLLRHRFAVRLLRMLMSDDQRAVRNGRLALLVIVLGLMDVRQNKQSVFYRLMLCLSGLQVNSRDIDANGLFSIVILRILNIPRLLDVLPPAMICMVDVLCLMSSQIAVPSVRLSSLRTTERPGGSGVSWPIALRLCIFLINGAIRRDNPNQTDLYLSVMSAALAASFRDCGHVHQILVERSIQLVPSLSIISLQIEFEDNPTNFCSQRDQVLYQFSRIQSPEHTQVLMPSDGSEIIGYVRDVATGEVVSVERDRLTAPLRGSRGRRRWNNEPVLRVELSDAKVSPNGLVLLAGDAILDPEFANIPNRSGSRYDRFFLGAYPEIVIAGDRSIVTSVFQEEFIESGVLLTGLPNMGNFGHFILNGVSKFPVITAKLGADWDVVVPGKRSPFHDAIIDYCYLDPARFVFTEGVRGVRARRLDVIGETPMGMWPYNLLASLRAKLPRIRSTGVGRRIYLGRPDGARRSLANEESLLALLSEFDFEIVRPELLPFREQVAALQSADTIVAPHGSALLTLVFCHGTKRIVEIETKTSYRMALYNFLGHEAVRLTSKAISVASTTAENPFAHDYLDKVSYQVDLVSAREAIAWAVQR